MPGTIGRQLLSSLVYSGAVKTYMKMALEPHLFKDSEAELFDYIATHMAKFGTIPKQETIEDVEGLEDALVEAPEPPEFYLEGVEKRFLHNALKATVQEASLLLTNKQSEPALEVIMKSVAELYQKRQRKNLLDFRHAEKIIKDAYVLQKTMGNEVSMPFGWESLDTMSGGMRPGDFVTFVGRPQAGKAQPLDAKILTIAGWTTMGEIQIGDKLASVDGQPSEVVNIYPQGDKPVFMLKFQDVRSVKASDEHLWEVWYRDWEAPQILTTLQLIAKLECKRYQGRLSVRLFTGEYGTDLKISFSPYLIAAMIGDGCFRTPAPGFASEDPELVKRLDLELQEHGLSMVHTDRCNYRISGQNNDRNQLKEWLIDAGLWGCKSEDKFIPTWVFRCSKAIRQEFLQGLLDTDGTADSKGGVTYSSSSMRLAYEVQRLVWSLGGRAYVTVRQTTNLPSYRVSVIMTDRANLFWLERKQSRVSQPRMKRTNARLVLESIEYVGMEECQCIEVSHHDHLYVTDNYIVTHNTIKLLYTAHHAWMKGRPILFISMEMLTTIITQRLAAMHSHKKLSDIMKAELSTKAVTALMTDLHKLQKAEFPFWVADGSMIHTVDDIMVLCHQLKPAAAFVDGAYLLNHPDKRLSKWDKQAENARQLKQRLATDLGIPVVASYQLTKGSVKAKKAKGGKDISDGMEDVYGSDEMAQLSTVMLGLFDHEDEIEKKKKRLVKILKGRNGETGEFTINWDFSAAMNFSEVVIENPEDIQMDYMG